VGLVGGWGMWGRGAEAEGEAHVAVPFNRDVYDVLRAKHDDKIVEERALQTRACVTPHICAQ